MVNQAKRLAAATPGAAPGVAVRALSLRANFSWAFAGNVIYSACQWAMLVVLAKLGSKEMVGLYTLGLAITAPVMMLTNLQLRGIQATDARHQYVFGHYLGLRLLTTLLALAVTTGIVIIAAPGWLTALVILAVGAAKAFESFSDVIYGLLQQHERMDRIATSMMIKGPLSLIVFAVGVYLTHSVLWATLGLALTWALILAGYDIRSALFVLRAAQRKAGADWPRALRPIWDRRALTALAWLALPAGIVMALLSLSVNTPRLFVARYLGTNELAIFASMAYVLVVGATLTTALGQAAAPRLSQYFAAGNVPAFRALLTKLLGIGVALGGVGVLVGIVAGRMILTLLYRPDYAGHVDAFVWLLVAAGLEYVASFLGYAMTAARYLRIQVPIFVAVIAFMLVGAPFIIPAHGMVGAAWIFGGSFVLQIPLESLVIVYALKKRTRQFVGQDNV